MSISAIASLAPATVATTGVETTAPTADGGTITTITEPNGVQEVVSETGPATSSDTAAQAAAANPGPLQRFVDSLTQALQGDGTGNSTRAAAVTSPTSSSGGAITSAALDDDVAQSTSTQASIQQENSQGAPATDAASPNRAASAALHEFLTNATSVSTATVTSGSNIDGKA